MITMQAIVGLNRQYLRNLRKPSHAGAVVVPVHRDAIESGDVEIELVCAECGGVLEAVWNERCQWLDVTPCACAGKGDGK